MVSARFHAWRNVLVEATSGTEKQATGIGNRQPQMIPLSQWDDTVGSIDWLSY
jgi:hypothetical protein